MIAAVALVVTLLLVRTLSAAAPMPVHRLPAVEDTCSEAGPVRPC